MCQCTVYANYSTWWKHKTNSAVPESIALPSCVCLAEHTLTCHLLSCEHYGDRTVCAVSTCLQQQPQVVWMQLPGQTCIGTCDESLCVAVAVGSSVASFPFGNFSERADADRVRCLQLNKRHSHTSGMSRALHKYRMQYLSGSFDRAGCFVRPEGALCYNGFLFRFKMQYRQCGQLEGILRGKNQAPSATQFSYRNTRDFVSVRFGTRHSHRHRQTSA